MNEHVEIDRPIERLVDTIVGAAHHRGVKYIVIEEGRARFWIAGEWSDELEVPAGVFEPMVRRLCVMIGVLAPAIYPRKQTDQQVVGKLQFGVGSDDPAIHTLVRIDRERGLRALLELVAAEEFPTRSEPRLPTEHPFR